MAKVRITSTGHRSEVWVDDHKIPNLVSAQLKLDAERRPQGRLVVTMDLDFDVDEIDFEGLAAVANRVIPGVEFQAFCRLVVSYHQRSGLPMGEVARRLRNYLVGFTESAEALGIFDGDGTVASLLRDLEVREGGEM